MEARLVSTHERLITEDWSQERVGIAWLFYTVFILQDGPCKDNRGPCTLHDLFVSLREDSGIRVHCTRNNVSYECSAY